MSNKKYDVIVYIGRFQPVHNAHLQTIELARTLADRVVVVIGSAYEPRTYFKNPFNEGERHEMIRNAIGVESSRDVSITYAENNPSDTQWAIGVIQAVEDAAGPLNGLKVGKIGYKKDKAVERDLSLFPRWKYVDTPQFEPLNSTQIREVLFNPVMSTNYLNGVMHHETLTYLSAFRQTDEFQQLLKEKQYIEDYKKQFAGLPYPPIFVTADAVVIQSGYVLLVKRKAEPGKGLLALPGGFVNANEDASVEDAAIRELIEETTIDLPERVLRKSIKEVKVFDAVSRSARGRTITHAFGIFLDSGEWNLPKVKGSDDAEEIGTGWYEIDKLKRYELFDDHYEIIKYFISRAK